MAKSDNGIEVDNKPYMKIQLEAGYHEDTGCNVIATDFWANGTRCHASGIRLPKDMTITSKEGIEWVMRRFSITCSSTVTNGIKKAYGVPTPYEEHCKKYPVRRVTEHTMEGTKTYIEDDVKGTKTLVNDEDSSKE